MGRVWRARRHSGTVEREECESTRQSRKLTFGASRAGSLRPMVVSIPGPIRVGVRKPTGAGSINWQTSAPKQPLAYAARCSWTSYVHEMLLGINGLIETRKRPDQYGWTAWSCCCGLVARSARACTPTGVDVLRLKQNGADAGGCTRPILGGRIPSTSRGENTTFSQSVRRHGFLVWEVVWRLPRTVAGNMLVPPGTGICPSFLRA